MVDVMVNNEAFLARHTRILSESYQKFVGKPLSHAETAKMLFEAPFALVSHGVQDDPVFNYGNALALKIFAYSWHEFTRLPSKHSAEPVNQAARAAILAQVANHGFAHHYQGVRIAQNGTRFLIKNATIWNLVDETGAPYGQAALIPEWQILQQD